MQQRTALIIVLSFFAVVGVGFMFYVSYAWTEAGVKVAQERASELQPGAQVRTIAEKLTAAADSRESLNNWQDSERAGDSIGLAKLQAESRVVGLTVGTKCLFLKRDGLGVYRLRVLDGPFAGNEVWVIQEHVTPSP